MNLECIGTAVQLAQVMVIFWLHFRRQNHFKVAFISIVFIVN
jgi:hypothetical protein